MPEEFEGVATERGAVTNALVAEALAHGDMGLALPILAPSGEVTGRPVPHVGWLSGSGTLLPLLATTPSR